jgi:uncharacterized protein YyaL (SSP411 family)
MIPSRVTEAYAEMLKPKAKLITEAGISDLISELKEIWKKEGKDEEAARLDMVRDLVAEISMKPEDMKKLLTSFMSLQSDDLFFKKVSEIRSKALGSVKLDAGQLKDFGQLIEGIIKLYSDPADRTAREMVKRFLLKVLAYITDADLKTLFDAEAKLLALVKKNS